MRADARRRRRRRAARGLGRHAARRPSGWPRPGEIAFDPCHHHDAVGPMAGIISAVDAADRRRGPGDRGAGVLEPQRGRRALPALRRARRRRHGAPALDGRAPRPGAARRAARARRADRPQGDHRAGAPDGRRVPQPQRRGERRCSPARSRPALAPPRRPRRRRGARLPAHERLLVPELLDGREQAGHDGRPRRSRARRS